MGRALQPPDLPTNVDRAGVVGLRQQDVSGDGMLLAAADDLDGGHGALEFAAEVGALQVGPEPVHRSSKGEWGSERIPFSSDRTWTSDDRSISM